jgi:hypothetical protein
MCTFPFILFFSKKKYFKYFNRKSTRNLYFNILQVWNRANEAIGPWDVNYGHEAKLPMSSLGLGSIKLGSCATRLLNEVLVDTKIYSIIK